MDSYVDMCLKSSFEDLCLEVQFLSQKIENLTLIRESSGENRELEDALSDARKRYGIATRVLNACMNRVPTETITVNGSRR